jgi:large subunit ribosomal protein L21
VAPIREDVAMFAVIKTGGKQYRVNAGDRVKVESLPNEVGQQVTLSEVLAVGEGAELRIGAPLVSGAAVVATVLAHGRHEKVKIFKMQRRKHFQKHAGHRQNFTEIRIDSIA